MVVQIRPSLTRARRVTAAFAPALLILPLVLAEPAGSAGVSANAAPGVAGLGPESPPARPVARQLTASALSQAQDLRRALGFRSDTAYVKQTFEAPAATNVVSGKGTYGLNLTPAELQAARLRAEVDVRADDVRKKAEAIAPGRFAGVYVTGGSSNGGGTVWVQLTGNADQHLPDLQSALPAHLQGNVQVVSAAYTLEQLTQETRRIMPVISELLRERVALSAGIDEKGNRIEIGLADMSATNQATVRARLGSNMVGFVQGVATRPHHTGHNTRDTPFNPVQGSLHVHTGDSNGCTSAFATAGFYGAFFLTAGHCFANDTQLQQGGRVLGPVSNRTFGGDANVDAETIGHVNLPITRRIFWNYNLTYSDIHGVMAMDSDTVGNIVCMSGRWNPGDHNLNNNCGQVTARFEILPYGPQYGVFTCPCFRRATLTMQGGDSGSPYTWDTAYGRLAAGIHSGGVTGLGNQWYTHVPYAMQRWGLTLPTT
jgi:hypothetical protein